MLTFLELAHMVDATEVMGWGVGWGGDDDVPCTSHMVDATQFRVGVGMMTFLAFADVVDATQVMVDVPCTGTHGRCYACHGVGGGWGGMMTFLALATHGRCFASHD